MKESLAVRWVTYVGKQSRFSLWFSLIMGVCFIIFAVALSVAFRILDFGIGFYFLTGFIWLLSALQQFERRTFYRIIEQQNRRIAELESKKDLPQRADSRSK